MCCYIYRRLCTLIGHRAEISNALFSFDGRLVASGSMDQTCKLWDTRSGKVIETLRYMWVEPWQHELGCL